MILGFTGTRHGLTAAQRTAFPQVIATFPDFFIHGGAEGADTEADEFLVAGLVCSIEVYPCNSARALYWRRTRAEPHIVHPIQPPLIRNQVIVARCDHLLACPASMVEQRSGTWYTIRQATIQHKPLTMILPDGTIKTKR